MTEPAGDPDLWWINDAAAALDDQIPESTVHERIRTHLHRSNRRGVPVSTDHPWFQINTRALRLLLADTIWEIGRRDIVAIEFETESTTLTVVDINLIARYGDHLATTGAHIRAAVGKRLQRTIGPTAGAAITLHLQWSDLESPYDSEESSTPEQGQTVNPSARN